MAKLPIYDHKIIENDLYDFWKKNNLFEPIDKTNKTKNFSIILPPPNVTGVLHLGHAWDGALQDTMIRYKKLLGYRTIWIPGTDHAGIATQTKYEKILKEKGVDRLSLNDEEFLKGLHKWSLEQSEHIHQQWAKLGFALSYSNETYTLDHNVSVLVKKTFKQLYDKGLLYRATKLVNWDVKLKTPISDIEVVHKETKSKMYYFKYMIDGSEQYIEIATTRPETMFVDVAVFVNPKDKRYKHLIGKYVLNPVNKQKLKIYGDAYVDQKFGTGAMKCTPAHDFNDYQLAIKYKLKDYQSVINEDGLLNKLAKGVSQSYEGLDRLLAREDIVNEIKSNDLLIKIEDHQNDVGYSERTNEVVEPLLSEQWFVKMQPLVSLTKKLMNKQKPNFIPKKFKKTMDKWLSNVQDWCISRQLLWGHRIPAWYSKDNKKIIVSESNINKEGYHQDNCVLDTWFSSGLWPIALTIYAKNKNLDDFYPIDMLVTGYDILFFWVARMFFQCSFETNNIPLKNIFLHGLIRDEQNRKMSKSLNNGIDPMKVIDDYGADALRLFLISTASIGDDLRFSYEKIKYYWSFINKLWNAHNYIKMHNSPQAKTNFNNLNVINTWIINEFNLVLKKYSKNMEAYNFVVANKYLIEFIWETFCNQYLEFAKPLLNQEDTKGETIFVINTIFKNILILLHPHAPFVTDFIYKEMYASNISIMLETWPSTIKHSFDDDSKKLVRAFHDLYSFAKELRIKAGIKQSTTINAKLITKHQISLNALNELLKNFNINVSSISPNQTNGDVKVVVFKENIIEYENNYLDQNKEQEHLLKELTRLSQEVERSKNILKNKNFINKAPKEKVDLERQKLQQYEEQYSKIKSIISQK